MPYASKRVTVPLALLGFALALNLLPAPDPASAATPRLIVIEGGILSEPILLTDWNENLALMTGRSGLFQQPDESRPHVDVLEYWLNSLPADLSPSSKLGDPQARYPFYPATPNSPAVLGGYIAEQKALDILERHGVPTRIDWGASAQTGSRDRWILPLAGAATVVVMAIAAGSIWRIRSRGRSEGG